MTYHATLAALRVADLFCGAGGAAMGIYRACEAASRPVQIVGFDIKPQKHYPFEFVEADALTVDLSGFDAVWASPPCQAYIRGHEASAKAKHPRLVEPTRNKLAVASIPYIIENVPGAPLQNYTVLCGTMFGLKIIRHRWFECSWGISFSPLSCSHQGYVSHGDYAAVYGRNCRGPRRGRDFREPKPSKVALSWSEAMGIDWMTGAELSQAVPPAYSEFLWAQLLGCL